MGDQMTDLKRRLRWFHGIMAFIVIVPLVVYFTLNRTIWFGEFRGIEIGSTKQEALAQIRNIEGILSVSGFLPRAVIVKTADLREIEGLRDVEGFNVSTSGDGTVVIYMEDEKVFHISRTTGNVLNSVQVGDPFDDVKDQLLRVLSENSKASIISRIKGYGEGYFLNYFSLEGEPSEVALAWLMTQNTWMFHSSIKTENYVLHFRKGRLWKIEFTDYIWG